MKRVVIVAAIGLIAPFVAREAASAVPAPPPDPAPAASESPAPADAEVDSTTTTTTTTTTVPPAPETTTTTTVPPTTTEAPTTTAPTTTVPTEPAPTTTVAAPTDTTTTTAPAPVDSVDTTTTTTVPPPPPPEDIESEPIAPPAEAESGRVVLPAGAVDTGQLRPITFPVAGPITYVNDWGACRDGCRRAHKGNDLIGDRLQPLLAMQSGVVDRLLDHPTAGRGIVIRDDQGWEYHLYHVNNDTPGTDDGADDGTWSVAAGIAPGVRVTAGQLIGWMGDSGNSEGSVPHAHVEIHRPDGAAINPYWSLRRAQRDVNCAVPVSAPAPDVDPLWLTSAWSETELPAEWQPLSLTGGRPGSGETSARMWVNPEGFTPVDAASLRVGDARYDAGVDCTLPPTADVAPISAEMGAILATIRSMESGSDYTAEARLSTASGAYQFLDSSWGGYGGYARAKDAPPEVQDAKAAEHAGAILWRNGGDVSTIPVSWYIGHVPVGAEWDTVPRPDAGNRLTPREYQDRWMARYALLVGTPEAWTLGASLWTPVDVSATCHTIVIDQGTAGQPEYVLTQAQLFFAEPTGLAVPSPLDRCDPGRAPQPEPAVTTEIIGPLRRSTGF